MHSGSSLTSENPDFSISIGIAALIIEGRPLYDDEYVIDSADSFQRRHSAHNFPSSALKCYRSAESSQLLFDSKHRFHLAKTPDRAPSGSSAFASKTDSTEHLERLRQKLHQLRSLPSTSYDFAEQSVSVSIDSPPPPSNTSDLDHDELLDIIYERRSTPQSATTSKDKPTKPFELQFLASRSTSLQRTPRSLTEHNGLLQTVTSWTTNKLSETKFSTQATASSSDHMSCSSSILSPNTSYYNSNSSCSRHEAKKRNGKVLGPHCMQFCIEVYLGPEHHVILLEQWIIQQNQDPGRFSMTIQSLCTAIRSQLHFSQITAWSDLLKASSPHDPELKSNPRIKTSLKMPFKPRLDILYRIRPYSDATSACFSATPIVHNFPETMITDHLSIKVSLKSLPRMKALPRLYNATDIACADLVSESPTTSPIIVYDRIDCHEKGKHRCPFDEESPPEEAISHRDKQLMKYKKRIMRRDKKKRNDELANQQKTPTTSAEYSSSSSSCNSNSTVTAQGNDAKSLHKLSMTHFSPLDQPTINPNKPPLYSSMSIDESEPISNSSSNTSLNSTATASSTPSPSSSSFVLNQTMQSIGMTSNTITLTKSTQTTAIEMTSVGTQTEENQHNARSNQTCNGQMIFHNCDFCGIEMQYFCWNCDKRMFMETTDSQDNLGKGDLLLKAIQRAPSVKQTQCVSQARTTSGETMSNNNNNNNNNNCNSTITSSNYTNNNNVNNLNNNNNNNNDEHTNSTKTTATTTTPYASDSSSNVISHSSNVCDFASDRDHCDSLSNKDELDVSDCRSSNNRLDWFFG